MPSKTPFLASVLVASLCAGATGTALAERGDTRRMVLNFKGVDPTPMTRTVPVVVDLEGRINPGEPMEANCFEADVRDLRTGRWLGTAEDCLIPLPPELRTSTYSGSGEQVVGTTIFNLRNGRLVIQGMTSVQPVNWPTENAAGQVFTHITGANSPENAVLIQDGMFPDGMYEELRNTGRYRDVSATVRLSGQVDLSAAPERIAFDCIFVVDMPRHD